MDDNALILILQAAVLVLSIILATLKLREHVRRDRDDDDRRDRDDE